LSIKPALSFTIRSQNGENLSNLEINAAGSLEINKIHLGDCLDLMEKINDRSIDLINCDLPYGITDCPWDIVIPFDALWKQYNRIIKDNGAIVLTANQPFTTDLINSNRKMFRYELIWEKTKATGFLNSKKMPNKAHENILVFYKKLPVYNPQKYQVDKRFIHRKRFIRKSAKSNVYRIGKNESIYVDTGDRYPISVLPFPSAGDNLHPTQKPELLYEYLIKMYSNPGDLVLDNCAGCGTTGVACVYTGRDFILIEKEEKYCRIAQERINDAIIQLKS
jgi:site-specific DNA-methyltransferase (adenine-specific)